MRARVTGRRAVPAAGLRRAPAARRGRVPALVSVVLAALALLWPAVATAGSDALRVSGPVSDRLATAIVQGDGIVALPAAEQVTVARLRQLATGTAVSVAGLDVGGYARAYLVVAPAHRTGRLPLVVVLGGTNAPATLEAVRDELYELAQRNQAVVAYAAGYLGSWAVGVDGCCGARSGAGQDDVAYVSALVAQVQDAADVDPARTYLVGYSGGGKLAYSVVCARPQLFAAFTAVAATPVAACANGDQPAVSVQVVVGGTDPELPITGAATAASVAEARAAATWRARDGCPAAARTSAAGAAVVSTWTGCRDGTVVRTVLNPALSHDWPTVAVVGTAAAGVTLVGEFFGL